MYVKKTDEKTCGNKYNPKFSPSEFSFRSKFQD